MGGGGPVGPLVLVFCPLLKISLVNPKFLTLQNFWLRMPLLKKTHTLNSFTLSQITLKYGSKNRSWFEGKIEKYLPMKRVKK